MGSRSYRGPFPLAVEASKFDFEWSHLLGFGVVLLLLRFGRRLGLLACVRTCSGAKETVLAVDMGRPKEKENSTVTISCLPENLTFSFFRLCLAQRRRRRLWSLHHGRRRHGYGRHLGHHGLDGGGYVGGGQRCVCGGGSSQGVVGAELSPLGAENHHHLGHSDLGVLGRDEGSGGERGTIFITLHRSLQCWRVLTKLVFL